MDHYLELGVVIYKMGSIYATIHSNTSENVKAVADWLDETEHVKCSCLLATSVQVISKGDERNTLWLELNYILEICD